ncbi:MAG: hypothetical protein U0359_08570 [Byssovorax sp.]
MSEERGRKLLLDLAKDIQEKVSPSGEPLLNREGLKMVERLARDLTGPGGMPGLKLWRDAPAKFRLQRSPRNAEISVHWQRDIGAMVMTGEKHGNPKQITRYIYEAAEERWRRMEGEGELYEDLAAALVEYLYPEGRKEG